MLSALSISDIVLIDHLDLDLRNGLCVLTGETGAGKSILLDALGLALGSRADAGLVRKGADRGVVVAVFDPPADHPAWQLLKDQDLDLHDGLILRRQVSADGRGRAFANDRAISVGLLRKLGESLVEVHGQHDDRGLLNPASHRAILDNFGGLRKDAETCKTTYGRLRNTERALLEAQEAIRALREEEEYLRHVCSEIRALAPKTGDEEELDRTRTQLRQGEKIAEALRDAEAALRGVDGQDGIEQRLLIASRALERVAESAGGAFDTAIEGLDRAVSEVIEGVEGVSDAARSLDLDPAHLEMVEERLFALRDAARKNRVKVDDLPALLAEFERRLGAIDNSEERLSNLRAEAEAARHDYLGSADRLSRGRAKAARKLDKIMLKELQPLALDKATFKTILTKRDEDVSAPHGWDQVTFQIATNPGSSLGPLNKIASGGELSRVMLALKVALAENRTPAALIFDEVDSDVGGAVADKVGERLARLSQNAQVIVVTHSPQVAARADHHWRIFKEATGHSARTTVENLDDYRRREEIARMLAGAQITKEARAAADSLLQAAGS